MVAARSPNRRIPHRDRRCGSWPDPAPALRDRLVTAPIGVTVVMDVTQQYLVGELSVLVGELQRATPRTLRAATDAVRHRVESSAPDELGPLVREVIAEADRLCWSSLGRGDLGAFAEQAEAAASLGAFAHAAHFRR